MSTSHKNNDKKWTSNKKYLRIEYIQIYASINWNSPLPRHTHTNLTPHLI